MFRGLSDRILIIYSSLFCFTYKASPPACSVIILFAGTLILSLLPVATSPIKVQFSPATAELLYILKDAGKPVPVTTLPYL